MKFLFSILRQRQGITLTEMVCASFLLIVMIIMCTSALIPAAKIMQKMGQAAEAQAVADSVLEYIRSEVEEAREYVRVYPNVDGGGDALEFVNRDGYTLLISTDNYSAAAVNEAGGTLNSMDGNGIGRLRFRYSIAASDYNCNSPKDDAEPTVCAEGAVFPDEFYSGLYLKLAFRPVLEDGMLMCIKITVQLWKVEDAGDGTEICNVICEQSVIAELRYATTVKDGVRIKTGLPFTFGGLGKFSMVTD